ncbi:MAG: DUF934 domain-containing protein [Gammaproteobacteria bacterium]
MPLLRQREVVVADEWVTLVDSMGDSPPADDVPLLVPFAKFRANPDVYRARKGKLGIRLSPADKVEDLAPELPRLSLVALEFTGPGEGRGYTQAKLLRARYHFTGEVRAVGHVKQDQVYLMARVGIDAFELSPGEKPEDAVATLERFKIAYTPGSPLPALRRERFHV